jgi:hypothetical protein
MSNNFLCFHIKGLLSGVISDEQIQTFVGTLMKLSQATYESVVSEIKTIVISLLDESYRFQEETFNHWVLKQVPEYEVVKKDGTCHTLHRAFTNPIIQGLVMLNHTEPDSDKILAGFCKLKTFSPPRKMSRSERDEAYKSIASPPTLDIQVMDEVQSVLPLMVAYAHDMVSREQGFEDHLLPMHLFPANDKKAFSYHSDGTAVTRKLNSLEPYNLSYMLRDQRIHDIYHEDPSEFVDRAFLGIHTEGSTCELPPVDHDQVPIGEISAVDEPGGKHRIIAKAHSLLQGLNYPTALRIKHLNDAWSCQGVNSHPETCNKIHGLMVAFSGSRTFHSIDMKSFTDRFLYRGYQRRILELLVNREYLKPVDLRITDTIVLGDYYFFGRKSRVRYETGTPMGTFASFPLASFSNGILLAISTWLAYGPSGFHIQDLPGMVIGDDIVIWDDVVADKYRQLASGLGEIISISKSISSTLVAEMCSKIITDRGVFDQKKLSKIPTSLSQVKEAFHYYRDYLLTYSEDVKQRLQVAQKIPQPYGLGRLMEEVLSDTSPLSEIETIFLGFHISAMVTNWIKEPEKAIDIWIGLNRRELYPPINIGKIYFSKESCQEFEPLVRALTTDVLELSKAIRRDPRSVGTPELIGELKDKFTYLLSMKENELDKETFPSPVLLRDTRNYETRLREKDSLIEEQFNKVLGNLNRGDQDESAPSI